MNAPAKKRLGELLIEAGVIDETQLRAALGHQRQWGVRLGQALVDLKLATEQDVVRALAKRFGFEVARLDQVEAYAHQQALGLVPREFAAKNNVFPLAADTVTLSVAMSDPTNLAVIDELRFRSGRRVKVSIGGDREIAAAIGAAYPTADGGVEAIALDIDESGELGEPVLDSFGGGSSEDFQSFFGTDPARLQPREGAPAAEDPFAVGPVSTPVPAPVPASAAPAPRPAAPAPAAAPAPSPPPAVPATAPRPAPAPAPAPARPPAAAPAPAPRPGAAPGAPAGVPRPGQVPAAARPPAPSRAPTVPAVRAVPAPATGPAAAPRPGPAPAPAPASVAPTAAPPAPRPVGTAPVRPVPPPGAAPQAPAVRAPVAPAPAVHPAVAAAPAGREALPIDLVLPSQGAGRDARARTGPEPVGAPMPDVEVEEELSPLADEALPAETPGAPFTPGEQAILAALQRLADGGHAEPEVVKPAQAMAALIRVLLRKGVLTERELLDALRRP